MKRRGKASSKPDNKFKVKPQKKEDEYHSLKNELNFYLKPTVARTESATSNIQKQRISGKYMVVWFNIHLDSESDVSAAQIANAKIRDLWWEDKFKVGMLMK